MRIALSQSAAISLPSRVAMAITGAFLAEQSRMLAMA